MSKAAENGRLVSFLRASFVFSLLVCLKIASRLFFRHDVRWIGARVRSRNVRIIAALNHTSLYEPLWAGSLPFSLLWRIARYGVVPVADKTAKRPAIGAFFKLLAQHVVVITRHADHTWEKVLSHIQGDSIVVIFPEGRMKRADGLDGEGKPMTVRGGIADILQATQAGTLLIGYLGGLHHVQVPGQFLPRAFKTVRIGLEPVDIPTYRQQMLEKGGVEGYKGAVIADLERRRDLHCPREPAGVELALSSILAQRRPPGLADPTPTPERD